MDYSLVVKLNAFLALRPHSEKEVKKTNLMLQRNCFSSEITLITILFTAR